MARARCYVVLLLLGVSFTAGFDIQNVGWWKNTVFYQIYPRSFMDSNGDGIGDLKGITSKLDHFVDLGIGGIWLSPIYASPMIDFGYDISDFKAVHEDYGTMDDFEELTAAAKSKNLKVILDLVPNHSSDDCDWFIRSKAGEEKYKDFYIWKEGNSTTPPNNWISVFRGSAWTYDEDRKAWYFHQFHKRQPDLNYNNQDVRKAMADVIWFWLEKGVAGFRVDAVPHLFEIDDLRDEPRSNDTNAVPNDYNYLNHIYTKDQPKTYELVKSWTELLGTYGEIEGSYERILMVEAYASLEKTMEYYEVGAHIPFNFKFIVDINNRSPPSAFKTVIDAWTTEANKRNATSNWVMGNHDNSRTGTRYPGRSDQMTMLAMILPGVSVTYYGEEIGMVDKDDISWEDTQDPQGCQAGEEKFATASRDPCRTPFQWDDSPNAGFSANETIPMWLPVNANYKTLNLAMQKNDSLSHYSIYKKLTTLKKTKQALIDGTLATAVKNSDEALVIVRTHNIDSAADHSVLLVINFSDSEQLTVDLTSEVPKDLALTGVISIATSDSPLKAGTTVNLSKLELAAKTSLVIEVDAKRAIDNTINGADSTSITFTKAAITLVATLFITLR